MTQVNLDLFGNPTKDDVSNSYVPKPPKDISDKIKTEYILEVFCNNESEQKSLYENFVSKGFKVNVIIM